MIPLLNMLQLSSVLLVMFVFTAFWRNKIKLEQVVVPIVLLAFANFILTGPALQPVVNQLVPNWIFWLGVIVGLPIIVSFGITGAIYVGTQLGTALNENNKPLEERK